MNEADIEKLTKSFEGVVDDVMEKRLADSVSPLVAQETRKIVEQLRLEKALFGSDRTGLSDEKKSAFAQAAKAISFGQSVKANEALIEESDSRGGYLVAKEVAAAVMRIAASVGIVMNKAQKWDLTTDELGVPTYTGAFLEGEYLGYDAAGSVTALTFGQARLIAKKWQLAFALGNDLMADASVNLANWLLAIGGESMANMIDKQGFIGSGLPFVGILNHPSVTVQTLTTGKTTFASFDLDEASDMIAAVEESVLDGAGFYFNRTVWAKLRMKKDTAGAYVMPQAGAVTSGMLANYPLGGGPRPVGEILGFPVFSVRHLPLNSATAISTKFCVFGNLGAMAFGDKGELSVEKFTSGAFGGKEIALADQVGLIYKNRHALVITLPAAFVVGKTAAS